MFLNCVRRYGHGEECSDEHLSEPLSRIVPTIDVPRNETMPRTNDNSPFASKFLKSSLWFSLINGVTITEIPLSEREAEKLEKFQVTIIPGGMPPSLIPAINHRRATVSGHRAGSSPLLERLFGRDNFHRVARPKFPDSKGVSLVIVSRRKHPTESSQRMLCRDSPLRSDWS
jgi:hypothetical protein